MRRAERINRIRTLKQQLAEQRAAIHAAAYAPRASLHGYSGWTLAAAGLVSGLVLGRLHVSPASLIPIFVTALRARQAVVALLRS